MNTNLKQELEKLDAEIKADTERLKAKKKARRRLAGALEQLNLSI